ncbi:MAG TPA: IclR family transcriptional regulator [Chitinophagaceae bacterium]|jgi:DNA-binding IclR family transcriptional regulator|nr:IclR family transcriptional regulator [Chitinophagaceae bacterium]
MVQVIIRGLDILEFVAQHGKEPVQLINIAEHMELSQPTTANIVKTLLHKNYLEQLGRRKGYRLGVGAYQLTGNLSYNQDLILAAKEILGDLTKQINETSLLAVIRNNKRVILHMEECNQSLQVKTTAIADVYPTSTGRLLMAYMSQKELDKLINNIGLPTKKIWPGAETREGLERLLKEIREKEFVQVLSIHHTVGFAAPVYRNKEVIAGLSVFIPESRYTESGKEKLYKLIRRTAKRITEQIEKSNSLIE